MKKKVCHLTSVHPIYDIRIFHKECKSLVNAGFGVTLIAKGYVKLFQKDGIELRLVELPEKRLLRMILVTFRFFRASLKTKAEIFHFHDPELMPCGVLLRLAGKKVIFDIHENVRLSIQTKEWLPKGLRGIIAAFYFITERFCLLFYNQLILAEESYQKYYPTKKSCVVLNYPILNLVEDKPKRINSPKRMVYAGVVHELKGIWEMLTLLKGLNQKGIDCKLLLVGEVRPAGLETAIISFLEREQLSDKVKITGKVEFSKVHDFLCQADIGLSLLKPIPNYFESLPTKIFEYMQTGLPVVTNNFPLYVKYINQSEAGICVDISEMEKVIDQVVELLTNSAELTEKGKNGLKAVKNWYNWQTESVKLIECYQNI